jgi:hypothetical protein
VQVLLKLCDVVWRKQRNKWHGQWFLHHDKTPSHASLVQELLSKTTFLSSPTHCTVLDLTSSDFWLFPALKIGLRLTHFTTIEGIKSNAIAKLQKIPKEAFHECFQQWQVQWSMCVYLQRS